MSREPSPNFNSVITALGRLHRIADALESGRPVTVSDLARREEVHRRTITRYMQFLTDSLGWEIERIPRGFRLVSKGSPLISERSTKIAELERLADDSDAKAKEFEGKDRLLVALFKGESGAFRFYANFLRYEK